MARQSKRLSEEKAQRVLVGLRAGETLRRYSLSGHSPAFQGYCQAHPDYAAEALPLASANTVAARLRKASRRNTTHCRAGLHLMVAENVRPDGGNGKKRCLHAVEPTCRC